VTPPISSPTGFAASTWYSTAAPGRWTERAACRRYPAYADQFTEAQTFEEADVALTICAECPVKLACSRYGQTIRADGVWGGELLVRGTPRRRFALRRRRSA
jgi:hypothetical protein